MSDATEEYDFTRLCDQYLIQSNKTSKVALIRARKALLLIMKFAKEERSNLLARHKAMATKPRLSPEARKLRDEKLKEAKEQKKMMREDKKIKKKSKKMIHPEPKRSDSVASG